MSTRIFTRRSFAPTHGSRHEREQQQRRAVAAYRAGGPQKLHALYASAPKRSPLEVIAATCSALGLGYDATGEEITGALEAHFTMRSRVCEALAVAGNASPDEIRSALYSAIAASGTPPTRGRPPLPPNPEDE